MHPLPEDDVIRRLYRTHSDAQIAKIIGRTLDWTKTRRQKRLKLRKESGCRTLEAPAAAEIPQEEQIRRTGSRDAEELESRSPRIKTLDQLLAAAEVDLEAWEVERYHVNKWESGAVVDGEVIITPLWQVKASLKRNKNAERLQQLRAAVLADIRAEKNRELWIPAYTDKGESAHLLELDFSDLHIGKLGVEAVTGEDYGLEQACARFLWGLEDLLGKTVGFPIDRIVMPIGNDLLHIDNLVSTTTAGTRQDADAAWLTIFRTARAVLSMAVERCLEIAPVDLVVVPGNHDRQSMLALGEVLAAQYEGHLHVQVYTGQLRQYYSYGLNLIGYTHGSEEKPGALPLLMATEAPELWAESKYREWHIGHLHKKKETQFVGVDEYQGVRVRIMSSLAGTDAWHYSQGYTQGWKAAEAYLWGKETGLVGQFSANLPGPLVVQWEEEAA